MCRNLKKVAGHWSNSTNKSHVGSVDILASRKSLTAGRGGSKGVEGGSSPGQILNP